MHLHFLDPVLHTLWKMLRLYALKVSVHLMILEEAVGEITLVLLNIKDSGRWSDSMMNSLP